MFDFFYDILEILQTFLKAIIATLVIVLLIFAIRLGINGLYSNPVDKKAKVIDFIVDKDKDKFETVLEVDGEIIFKDDKAFYYEVRDKLNQEIDISVKENKKNKIVELKDNN